eukprot:SAG11_NODE_2236_length_3652_cov_9.578666_2_plen_111_part_00
MSLLQSPDSCPAQRALGINNQTTLRANHSAMMNFTLDRLAGSLPKWKHTKLSRACINRLQPCVQSRLSLRCALQLLVKNTANLKSDRVDLKSTAINTGKLQYLSCARSAL